MAIYTHDPIPVYLRQEQYEALQELSVAQGVPLDELVRQGVDAVLAHGAAAVSLPAPTLSEAGPPAGDPWRDIIGMMDSGATDLSEHHDRYLADLIEAESRPWPEKSS